MAAVAEATSVDDLLTRLEADETLFRLDPDVTPTMYHCAIVSSGELEQLRLIDDVVRLGHLQRAEHDRIVLRDGEIEISTPSLYVDCTTQGLPRPPSVPVFDGARMTLQSVRGCQQVFSSAFIAHVEAAYGDDDVRNDLCAPITHPDAPMDWLRILLSDNTAQVRWLQDPELMDWLKASRLNVLRDLFPDFGDKVRVRDRAFGALTTALTKTNAQLSALMERG